MDAAWADEALDPTVLTIGFARRFASYKRATLLLSQPDRLKALLLDPKRPVQLIFAGKAHPADDLGKEMIRQIVQFARDPAVRHRIAFIEDYDIAVARTMLQGCDVWLNNPRRPMEASGTSGQKAALNGALNLSVLDGWWDEMFDGKNGWQIASAEGVRRPPAARRGGSQQPVRDTGTPGRASLLRPRRRPFPPPVGGEDQGFAQLARPAGPGVADGEGLHEADVRAHGQAGRRPHRPTATPAPRLWRPGRRACSAHGRRWPCCPSTSTRRPW